MTEENAPAQPTSEESFINADGTYKEGWKEAMLPEELRGEQFYDSPFNANVKELLKTAGNQAKMLGKKGAIPLDAKSNEFEVQAWRKALNIPDSYVYQKPTDLKTIDIPDEFVNQTLDGFNKLHMTQAQVDFAMNQFGSFWKATEAEFEKAEAEEVSRINQQILTEENTSYEENSLHIDNAVRQGTQGWSDEDIQKLFGTVDSKGGINSTEHIELKPLLRKFLITIGKSIGEHHMIAGDTSGKSLQQQLDEVMSSPEYQTGYGKLHTEAVEKAAKLREQINTQLGKSVYQ